MANRIDHAVPGLPEEAYSVSEHTTGMGQRFIPRMRGRALVRLNGQVAWETSLEAAQQSCIDLVARMQS